MGTASNIKPRLIPGYAEMPSLTIPHQIWTGRVAYTGWTTTLAARVRHRPTTRTSRDRIDMFKSSSKSRIQPRPNR